MPGTIVVVGRYPDLNGGRESPGYNSFRTPSKGERQLLWDYEANSLHLRRAISTGESTKAIIVCREVGQDDGTYQALLAQVRELNIRNLPVIEAEPAVRKSPGANLDLPDSKIDEAIAEIKKAAPAPAPQRTWGEFRDQCLTLPKMPASLGIVEALSSAATMASLKLKSWSSPASYTKLSKDVTEVKDSTAKEATVPSCAESFKSFVSWAYSKMPWAADKDKGIGLANRQ